MFVNQDKLVYKSIYAVKYATYILANTLEDKINKILSEKLTNSLISDISSKASNYNYYSYNNSYNNPPLSSCQNANSLSSAINAINSSLTDLGIGVKVNDISIKAESSYDGYDNSRLTIDASYQPR